MTTDGFMSGDRLPTATESDALTARLYADRARAFIRAHLPARDAVEVERALGIEERP